MLTWGRHLRAWKLVRGEKEKVKVTQSCLTLCDPMDCSPPGSSVHGILRVRILEWVAIPFSRGSSRPQGSNPGLPYCRRNLYHLSHQGIPTGSFLAAAPDQIFTQLHTMLRAMDTDRSQTEVVLALLGLIVKTRGQHTKALSGLPPTFVNKVLLKHTLPICWHTVLPGDSESACNAGDLGLISGSGRSPGGRHGYPLQYSYLENSVDGGAWGATVHGVPKSQTRLSDSHFQFHGRMLIQCVQLLLHNEGRADRVAHKVYNIYFPVPYFKKLTHPWYRPLHNKAVKPLGLRSLVWGAVNQGWMWTASQE